MKFRPVPGAYGVEDVTILDEAGRVTSGGLHDGSMVAAAGLIHDLGNLIQIAYSAINILARAPDMPALRSGPILHRARSCLEHAGALVRQNIEPARDKVRHYLGLVSRFQFPVQQADRVLRKNIRT